MTRLILAGVVVGVLAAGTVAWNLRQSVAYAEEVPVRDHATELLQAAVEGCASGLGVATVQVQGGVWVIRCQPNLGIAPVKPPGRPGATISTRVGQGQP